MIENTTLKKTSDTPSGPGAAIPNIFTLLNLFFGCMAIVFALQTDAIIININDEFNTIVSMPEKLTWAAFCICIAASIDFLDGFLARLLKATSSMGKQLDSLSDVVSFGVAPGVIIYQLLRVSFARQEDGLEISILWLVPAFILSCAAAYRLAKFNLDDSQATTFKGVPVPAIGLLVSSFPLILYFNTIGGVNNLLTNKWFLYSIVIILSYLMISNIRIMSLKFVDFTFKNNIPKIILLVIGIIAATFLQWIAVPIVFIFYIILSLSTIKMKSE